MVRVPIWRKILVSTALHCLHTCTRGGSSLSYVKHDIIVLIQHCKKKNQKQPKKPQLWIGGNHSSTRICKVNTPNSG